MLRIPPAGPRLALLLAFTLAGAIASRPARAEWPHDPHLGAVPVCTAAGAQQDVRVVSDGAAGAIVVWADLRAGSNDIYAQRVNSAGQPMWAGNGVALCAASGDQSLPDVVPDGAGGAIVVWQDLRGGAAYDIYAQRVSSGGTALWTLNGVPVCTATGRQAEPQLTVDGAGGAVIAWLDERGGTANRDVYAQQLDAIGQPQWTANGLAVCTAVSFQDQVRVTTDGLGGALVAWLDFRNASHYDLYIQRVHGGANQWTANGVAVCTSAGSQFLPAMISDGQGGAVLAWQDPRLGAANNDIYAQRINAAGSPLWNPNGVQLTSETMQDVEPKLAPDGSGGAIVAWSAQRAVTGYDVVATRVTAGGVRPWGASGVTLANPNLDQFARDLVPDGLGGAIVAFDDARGGVSWDVFAMRVLADGGLYWDGDGSAVSLANGGQQQVRLVPDGRDGAILAWRDARHDAFSDVYAQRLDFNGALGDATPVIVSVRDVPNDQGGRVVLTWEASWLDREQALPYCQYRIWRSVPPHALAAGGSHAARATTRDAAAAAATGLVWTPDHAVSPYAWELADYESAVGLSRYSRTIAVPADSVAGSNPRTAFMVEIERYGYNPQWVWSSAPDSGYAVDNLAPAAPAPFTGLHTAGATRLLWAPNHEPDLAGYELHRGVSPGFVPGPATLHATLSDTGYVDHTGSPYVYKLVAVDTHGNASPPATYVAPGTVDAPAAGAHALDFAPVAPNPARGSARLRFTLPRAGHVRLEAFDAGGRRVRALLDEHRAAGVHDLAFDFTDDAGRALSGGLYLVRLQSADGVFTRRVFMVR